VKQARSCTRPYSPAVFQPEVRAVKFLRQPYNGVWRSPVARLLWEQEVPGSNPGAPIL
jgi:hypothetical protein